MPLELLVPISQLHSDLPPCKVKVWTARVWAYYKQHKPTEIMGLDLLLVDEKGNRIQASIRSHEKELEEGGCYMIMNFEILHNNGSYKASSHPYKINFVFMKHAKKSIEEIPNFARCFKFVPFPVITYRNPTGNDLIDLIGVICCMDELKDINIAGRQTKLLNLQLKDLGNSEIDVTLWKKWAEDMYAYAKNFTEGPIVVVGSLMKTKPFNGSIHVQSSTFSTKLFINSPITEINEFKECLPKYEHQGSSAITTISTIRDGTSKIRDGTSPNKIKRYMDCSYISPCEAAWRIFGFEIHYSSTSVQGLSFHIHGEHYI